MSNKLKISDVTQIAEGNCNINVTTINCNAVTVSHNGLTTSTSTNDHLLPSTIQNTKAFDDLQNFFQSTIGLTMERIFDVLRLPLSTKEDKEKREKFLKTQITNDNAFEILNLTYELNDLILRDITENFIMDNIKEITENERIPQISEDRLENIFKKISDKPNVKIFFATIKKWKNHNTIERRKHFCRLIRTIWKKTLEINDMKFIAIDFTDELDGCESCVKISKEIIRKHFFSGTKSHLLCLTINPENREFTGIKIFDLYENYWYMHIDIQSNLKYSSNIIMNDKLILIGGINVKKETKNETFRFDIKSKKKLPMGFMNTKRLHCALAILDDNLYVIGGRNKEIETLSCVEVWNSITDKWVNVRDMNRKRFLHAAVTLNEKLYVFGGYDHNGEMYTWHKSIEIYDAQKDHWTYIEYDTETICMTIAHICLALPINDKILFLDLNQEGDLEWKMFCPSTETLTNQSDVPKQRIYYDLILLNENIFLIGDPKNYLYNLKEKCWTEFKTIVKPCSFHTTFSYSFHV